MPSVYPASESVSVSATTAVSVAVPAAASSVVSPVSSEDDMESIRLFRSPCRPPSVTIEKIMDPRDANWLCVSGIYVSMNVSTKSATAVSMD